MKSRFSLLAVALALLSAAHVFGYALLGDSWTKNRTVVMHLSLPLQTFSDGLTYISSAEDALHTWNQYLAHMQFAVVRNSAIPPNNGDADNSVFVSGTIFGETWGASTLAVTLRLTREHTMSETDVIFKESIEFDDYRGPLHHSAAGTIYDFHRIALHEFGHVVGLDHPDENHPEVGYVAPSPPPPAIMNSRISDIDALQPDDINGGKSIYANGPAYLSSRPAPNLVNLSTRAVVAPGDNALIGGFIVQGSQPATVVLRAIGHSLIAQGIAKGLEDPQIDLRAANGTLVASSDDWISDNASAETIASYRLDPSNSRESALVVTLNAGSYTATVHSYVDPNIDQEGTALFELYDLHTTAGRAGNLSTRGRILGNDDVLIGGFIIGGGAQGKTVAARGLGPSLSAAGVANPLSDPVLELHNASGTVIASNNDWQQSSSATAIRSEGLAPTDPRESALQATLAAGSYTAIVRGSNGAIGIGLIELYDLSPAPQ
jgi:hypothetical protein